MRTRFNNSYNQTFFHVLFGVCAYACLFVSTGLGQAEDDLELIDLDALTITATREERQISDLPYAAHVARTSNLEASMPRNLPEALGNFPGIMTQKTANGHGSPFLRGFTGYRSLVLVDGIRYNNSVYRDGPNEYFSLIDMYSVDAAEVLLGPASALYGSDAIGGVLNLLTKETPMGFMEKGVRFSSGSFYNRYSTAESSSVSHLEWETGEGGNWGFRIGTSYKDFGNLKAAKLGTHPNTGYDEWSYDTRFDTRLSEEMLLTIVWQSLYQDDVWRTHSTTSGISFKGTTTGTDLVRLKDQSRSLGYIKLRSSASSSFANQGWTFTLSRQSWGEEELRVRSSGTPDFNPTRRQISEMDSTMWGLDFQMASAVGRWNLIYGADYYEDLVDTSRVDTSWVEGEWVNPRVRIQGGVGDDSSYSLFGAYVQAEGLIIGNTRLTLGTRYSKTDVSIGKYDDPLLGESSFADSWDAVVFNLRLQKYLSEDESLSGFAGISQSFRAPNVADLTRFGKSSSSEQDTAATNLSPERFLSIETGLRKTTARTSFSVVAHYTFVNDFITSTPTGESFIDIDGTTVYYVTKRNSAKGEIYGIEIAIDQELGHGFSYFGNATWLHGNLDVFLDTSSLIPVREPMSRIQPLTVNLGVRWDSSDKQFWLSASGRASAKADRLSSRDMADSDRIPAGGTSGYILLGVRGGWRIKDSITLQLGLENLLNEAYRVHGSGTNEPGFGANLGLKLDF